MLKRTRQKETILEVLRNTRIHPTVDWIYMEVRNKIPKISLGTVYRNLRLMTERGVIMELDISGGLRRFDAYTHNHYHLRCEKCNGIFDVDMPVNKDLDIELSRITGHAITYHRLEFHGLCKKCKNQGF